MKRLRLGNRLRHGGEIKYNLGFQSSSWVDGDALDDSKKVLREDQAFGAT